MVGINGQLGVCLSKLLVFMQYNKQKQPIKFAFWRVQFKQVIYWSLIFTRKRSRFQHKLDFILGKPQGVDHRLLCDRYKHLCDVFAKCVRSLPPVNSKSRAQVLSKFSSWGELSRTQMNLTATPHPNEVKRESQSPLLTPVAISHTRCQSRWTPITIIIIINIHRLKKGVSVSVFVTVTSRKLEYPQTEL